MRSSAITDATFEVVVTRDAARAAPLATRLAGQGARVVAVAVTRTAPPAAAQWQTLLDAVRSIERYGTVVVTSGNAADALAAALAEVGGGVAAPVVAVGAVTRDALAGHGIAATCAARADAIGAAEQVLAGGATSVLWPRAESGRDDGIARLRAAGVTVDAPVAYRTVTSPADDAALGAGLDALILGVAVVCVYAPSQVAALAELLAARGADLTVLAGSRVVAIGETTAAALRDRGVRVDAIATTPDPDAMAHAIAAVYPGRTS